MDRDALALGMGPGPKRAFCQLAGFAVLVSSVTIFSWKKTKHAGVESLSSPQAEQRAYHLAVT